MKRQFLQNLKTLFFKHISIPSLASGLNSDESTLARTLIKVYPFDMSNASRGRSPLGAFLLQTHF
jgi:hypothetical protein